MTTNNKYFLKKELANGFEKETGKKLKSPRGYGG